MPMPSQPSIFMIATVDVAVFAAQRARLLNVVQEAAPCGSVVEVGSTAVEGVIGKGDIDIAVRVPRLSFAAVRAEFDRRFRRNAEQLSNDKFQGYLLDSPLDAAIQLFVADSEFDHFEPFLALLRSSAELRAAYNDLKRRYHNRPMDEYRSAKNEFITTALQAGGRVARDG
jgi:GrpB-like predicted nucleotidyltransferase (UPF0157 family)